MTSQLTSLLEVSRGSKAVYERTSEMKVVSKLRDVGILISLTDLSSTSSGSTKCKCNDSRGKEKKNTNLHHGRSVRRFNSEP